MSMRNRPASVTVAMALILLAAAMWLAFGLVVLLDAHPALPELPAFRFVLIISSLGAAAILLVLHGLLRRRVHIAWYAALILFLATAATTIFDDVGWADVAVIVLSLVPAFLLIRDRAWYLGMASR